ncbi:HNH endonuclease signature motif containing protein [Citrobacter koseri]|uniref:HNH endonuclease signature motif containing protein n=1 Tax=Citrobacter koseri TaxID=545 RepID=UPI0040431E07
MSDTITTAAIKKLYGLSAGQCNICRASLFKEQVHIGQMAHVIAKSPKGPRGDDRLANDNSYENLILLCANDHILVDRDPSTYTVEKLHQIKREHEAYIESVTSNTLFSDKNRQSDIEFLNAYFHYTPFARVRSLVETLPDSFHTDFLIFGDQFDNILRDFPAGYPLNDKLLHGHFQNFIDSYNNIDHIICGHLSISDNRHIQVFGGANHNLYCHFNYDELPLDKASIIEQELITHKISLLNAYDSFINYIRAYYPEVEIYSPIL